MPTTIQAPQSPQFRVRRGIAYRFRQSRRWQMINLIVGLLGGAFAVFVSYRVQVPSYTPARTAPLTLKEIVRDPVSTFEAAVLEQSARCEFMQNKRACAELVWIIQNVEATFAELCTKGAKGFSKTNACVGREYVRQKYLLVTNDVTRFLQVPR